MFLRGKNGLDSETISWKSTNNNKIRVSWGWRKSKKIASLQLYAVSSALSDAKASCNLSEESENEMDCITQMSSSFVHSPPGASNCSVAPPDLLALTQNDDLEEHLSRPSSTNNGDGSSAHSSAEPNKTPVQSRKRKYVSTRQRTTFVGQWHSECN